MKSRSRTNKISLEGMAAGSALLLAFAVSLATSGFVLSANANQRKTTIITFDAPGSGKGMGQGTLGIDISPSGLPPARPVSLREGLAVASMRIFRAG